MNSDHKEKLVADAELFPFVYMVSVSTKLESFDLSNCGNLI